MGELNRYRSALDYLFARTTGTIRPGLERTHRVLEALGAPERRLRVLHVAGTNGKGSVVHTLDSLLRDRGLRVGRYTSPHLVDFRERIAVDGTPIAADEVTGFVERWTPTIERLGATFFEATTALAFRHFADAGVDVAVIETGLGGRLDSTNVVDPVVAGVTSIGLDHRELLGDTVEQVAAEKAGIFKAGRPAVIGETEPAVAALLAEHARAAGTSAILTTIEDAIVEEVLVGDHGTSFDLALGGESTRLRTALAGRHQAANAATALLMLHAAGPEWRRPLAAEAAALSRVSVPGRFQRLGRRILDVAHNPAGATVLAQTLRVVAPPAPVAAVVTVLRDKDWRGVLDALAPVVDLFVVTRAPTAPPGRGWDPGEAVDYLRERERQAVLEEDFERALLRADAAGGTTLVTGSFHTVGDALALLQGEGGPG